MIGYPILVDFATAKAIKGLAKTWHDVPDGMRATLLKCLSPPEVDAAKKRLFATPDKDGFSGLLEHLYQLEQSGRVVNHDQWADWRDPQTGKSAYDLLRIDENMKGASAESRKSYLAQLDGLAEQARQLQAERGDVGSKAT